MKHTYLLDYRKGRLHLMKQCSHCVVPLSKGRIIVSLFSRVAFVLYWFATIHIVNNPWDYPLVTGYRALMWELISVILSVFLLVAILNISHRPVSFYWKRGKNLAKFFWMLFNLLCPICEVKYLCCEKGTQYVPCFFCGYFIAPCDTKEDSVK